MLVLIKLQTISHPHFLCLFFYHHTPTHHHHHHFFPFFFTQMSNVAVEQQPPLVKKSRTKLQKDTEIPKTIFRRCIREYSNQMHMTPEAADLLQSESEKHVVAYLSDVARVAHNAGRETILFRDTETVRDIRKNGNNSAPL